MSHKKLLIKLPGILHDFFTILLKNFKKKLSQCQINKVTGQEPQEFNPQNTKTTNKKISGGFLLFATLIVHYIINFFVYLFFFFKH